MLNSELLDCLNLTVEDIGEAQIIYQSCARGQPQKFKVFCDYWAVLDSNQWPPACRAGALTN